LQGFNANCYFLLRRVLRGWATAPGRPRIGFGEASGTVLPAR
jgi:fumarylacetoacetase